MFHLFKKPETHKKEEEYKSSDLPMPMEQCGLSKEKNDPARFGPLDQVLITYLLTEKRELPLCSDAVKNLIEKSTSRAMTAYNKPISLWMQIHLACTNIVNQYERESPRLFKQNGAIDPDILRFINQHAELHTFKGIFEQEFIYNYAIQCILNDTFWSNSVYISYDADNIKLPENLLDPLKRAFNVIRSKVDDLYEKRVLPTATMSQFEARLERLIKEATPKKSDDIALGAPTIS